MQQLNGLTVKTGGSRMFGLLAMPSVYVVSCANTPHDQLNKVAQIDLPQDLCVWVSIFRSQSTNLNPYLIPHRGTYLGRGRKKKMTFQLSQVDTGEAHLLLLYAAWVEMHQALFWHTPPLKINIAKTSPWSTLDDIMGFWLFVLSQPLPPQQLFYSFFVCLSASWTSRPPTSHEA